MSELVFVKLGGSLITDKLRYETPRLAVIARLAKEIQAALEAKPDLKLVLGHGSGSFGHFVADRYKVHEGHLKDWRGYVETAAAAQRLDRLVLDALLAEGVRAVNVQPSASARCHQGELIEMAVKAGDKVLFGKWSGTEVKIDGQDLLIMKESDIMGVIEGCKAGKSCCKK